MTDRIWWKWPRGYLGDDYLPWYAIARQFIGLPFIWLAVPLLWIGVAMGHSVKDANRTIIRLGVD